MLRFIRKFQRNIIKKKILLFKKPTSMKLIIHASFFMRMKLVTIAVHQVT
ncbi:hypothetical protein EMIT079MI2_20196 [Bacillus sp. IT-79MI2]